MCIRDSNKSAVGHFGSHTAPQAAEGGSPQSPMAPIIEAGSDGWARGSRRRGRPQTPSCASPHGR
eukprot:9729387-Alexandrium_andersonii.AAC.1